MTRDDEWWSPEERARLDALPRERVPDPRVKAGTREALCARGALASGGRRGRAWGLRAAAAIAIFLAGGLVGRATVRPDSAGRAIVATEAALAPAERIQHAGTRYVETVADLVTALDDLPAETRRQGQEVAVSALRGAADQVVRLPGHDGDTERLLLELRGLRKP